MAKNKIQFQKGYSLTDFYNDYGTEEACEKALFSWKWPEGFRCPQCHSQRHCALRSRRNLQCADCHHQTSLTTHTIFASTKLPLTTWFLAIHLITQAKTGLSALALMRQLGVSYNTAWSMKHKIMQVMKERDERYPLSGLIQVDDAYWGGKRRGGKRGRGAANKTPFIAAVSVGEDDQPQYMKFQVIDGFSSDAIDRWASKYVASQGVVISDGLACFAAFKRHGFAHFPITTKNASSMINDEVFNAVNTMLGNVKNSIHGAYHAVSARHLPRYLAEFSYRFNRRFDLSQLFPRFMRAAVITPPMPNYLLKLAEDYG